MSEKVKDHYCPFCGPEITMSIKYDEGLWKCICNGKPHHLVMSLEAEEDQKDIALRSLDRFLKFRKVSDEAKERAAEERYEEQRKRQVIHRRDLKEMIETVDPGCCPACGVKLRVFAVLPPEDECGDMIVKFRHEGPECKLWRCRGARYRDPDDPVASEYINSDIRRMFTWSRDQRIELERQARYNLYDQFPQPESYRRLESGDKPLGLRVCADGYVNALLDEELARVIKKWGDTTKEEVKAPESRTVGLTMAQLMEKAVEEQEKESQKSYAEIYTNIEQSRCKNGKTRKWLIE